MMDEGPKCSLCSRELDIKQDPRCGHICASCKDTAGRCTKCSSPSAAKNQYNTKPLKRSRDSEVTDAKRICSRCEESNAAEGAVSYCPNCCERICDKHLQQHREYFREHRPVDIQDYEQNLAWRDQQKCSVHPSFGITHACQECLKVKCARCITDERCPKSGKEHTFQTLSKIADIFKEEFDELLVACGEQITNTYKLENEAKGTLDSHNRKCDDMKHEANKTAEEQITEISRSAEKLTHQIEDYQVDRTNRGEVFVSDLLMRREKLEEQQKSLRHLLQSCSVVEQIRQKGETITKMKEALNSENSECGWEEMCLMPSDLIKDMRLQLASIPSRLEYRQSNLVRDDKCQSICFTTTGDLILSHVSQIGGSTIHQFCRGTLTPKISQQLHGNVLSVTTLSPQELVILFDNGSIAQCAERYTELSIVQHIQKATCIAATKNVLYVLSKQTNCDLLNKCHFTTEPKAYRFPSTTIVAICCHPDGNILAIDRHLGVLHKCRVDDEKETLQFIWSCYQLPGAYAVCTDKCGRIYVAASGRRLYIVSEGVIQGCLKENHLPEIADDEYGNIAVYDGGSLVAFKSLKPGVKRQFHLPSTPLEIFDMHY